MDREKNTPPRIVAFVQARMSSSRLPGKVLADIRGKPMLLHVVDRARRASMLDEVVVATSDQPADDAIAGLCSAHGVPVFRGSEDDVLDRFYRAATRYRPDVVVRITADCPLIDPEVIEVVVRGFLEADCDYASNTLHYTWPDGLDVEVFSWTALEQAWREASLAADREHVTPYMRNSGRFRLLGVEAVGVTGSDRLRWTVDEEADLVFVREVYGRLGRGGRAFGFHEVVELLEKEPALMDINQGIIRNEGFYKSLLQEPSMAPLDRSLERSMSLKARAAQLIPSWTQTFSKNPSQFVQGVAPVFIERGAGSHVWDVDGNEYIDYPMALGPVILGHNYPEVTRAVQSQLEEGTSFSLPHPLELEVAELLNELIPCAEMIRFGKNGSDATSGAVRVARAYTGRDVIACCGYHGWQDWYIGTTTRNQGVPKAVQELTVAFRYNDIESLERIFADHPGDVAAVILEPVGLVEPEDDFLARLRELTRREGAVLIFDEVITGFRIAMGGAQEHFGVTPDLACFGKAMGNGYPIAAVVGSKQIMRLFDEAFFSFTFGGETASLAATKATITEMREREVIPHLWEQGERLKDGFNVLARELGVDRHAVCIGLPPRTVALFKDEAGEESLLYKSLFQQECLKRGILFSGGQNICFSHGPSDIDQTLRVYKAAFEVLRDAVAAGDASERLEGQVVEPVFRKP